MERQGGSPYFEKVPSSDKVGLTMNFARTLYILSLICSLLMPLPSISYLVAGQADADCQEKVLDPSLPEEIPPMIEVESSFFSRPLSHDLALFSSSLDFPQYVHGFRSPYPKKLKRPPRA